MAFSWNIRIKSELDERKALKPGSDSSADGGA